MTQTNSNLDPTKQLSHKGDLKSILTQLNERLARIEQAIGENNGRNFNKEWYTVAETAEILKRKPYTVREWCRLKRIHASKTMCGRGGEEEWRIRHDEISRIQNDGLLPIPRHY